MIWYKHLLWLTLWVLFLLESSLMPWFLPGSISGMEMTIAAHFAFVLILYIGIYLNRRLAIGMALAFGLLHDVLFYGHVLGAYTFSMCLTTYVISMLLRDTHVSWYTGLGSITLGILAFDYLVFGLYTLFQITSVSPWWYLMHAALPTLLLNMIFASAIYYPVIQIFARIEKFVAPQEAEDYKAESP